MKRLSSQDIEYIKAIEKEFDVGKIIFNREQKNKVTDAIERYYNGHDKDAALFLIRSFYPFLKRFTHLLCGELMSVIYCNKKNGLYGKRIPEPLIKFLNFYADKPVDGPNKYKNGKTLLRAIKRIEFVYKKYSYEELFNITITAFLTMAYKYYDSDDDNKKQFYIFAKYQFCFFLQHELNKQKSLLDKTLSSDHERFYTIYNKIQIVEPDFDKINSIIDLENSKSLKLKKYNYGDLDFNWISGLTCSDIFNCLSPYERQLIIELYYDNNTIEYVSNKHNVSIQSTKKRLVKVISKLKKECEKYNFI